MGNREQGLGIRRLSLILIPLTIYIIIYYRAFSSRGAKTKTDGEKLRKIDKIKNIECFIVKPSTSADATKWKAVIEFAKRTELRIRRNGEQKAETTINQ